MDLSITAQWGAYQLGSIYLAQSVYEVEGNQIWQHERTSPAATCSRICSFVLQR